jgi:flagellar P-ring protein FlgI
MVHGCGRPGKNRGLGRLISLCAAVVLVLGVVARPAQALRIRDAVRLKNEVPNELMGMGLVVGLPGTGDGDDFLPAMQPLKALLVQFGNPVNEKDLKNAKNVAIVSLSVIIPPQGAHSGESLDVKVSALAAKNLKGGRLLMVPVYFPRKDVKIILASASGDLTTGDTPTEATIRLGATMIQDVLPEEIKNNTFTLVIHPGMAARELTTAIADQINEDVAPQTGGKAAAIAMDATSVQVTIPEAERANPTPFIARLMTLPLPTLPDPARVTIDMRNKVITFSDEVEVAPTMISQGNLTITIGAPANATGSKAPFVVLDPKGSGNAKLRDLQNAFNLLKVSPDDRIAIVKQLHKANALKAELIVE